MSHAGRGDRPHRSADAGQPRCGASGRPRPQPDPGHGGCRATPAYCTLEGRNEVPETLDAQIIEDAGGLFEEGEKMQLQYTIRNTHRAIGTKLSSKITRQVRHGRAEARPHHRASARLGRPVARRLRGAGPQAGGLRRCQRLCRQGAVRRHHRGPAHDREPAGDQPQHHHRQHRALWRHRRQPLRRRPGGRALLRAQLRRHGPWSRAAAPTAAST